MRSSISTAVVVLAVALAATQAAGCGDGGPNCIDVVVTILSPSDGAEIGQAGGGDVEIALTVRVDGLEPGDDVELSVNGTAVATPATLNANREATFNGVVVPQGGVTLAVTGTNHCDDEGSDSVEIFVVGDLQCGLAVANGTVDSDFYTQPVLNSSVDGDAGTPGFQATVEVQTAPGFRAELIVLDVDLGSEASAGIENADATSGIATFDLTLAEGVQALRAQCVSASGGTSGAAPAETFFVDTKAPTCAITGPSGGANVTPDDDEDLVADGTQITLTASITGGDTEDEAATFTVGTLDIDGTDINSQGDTTATATFSSPGTKSIAISSQDHALNTCTDSIAIDYVTDGCGITITAPSGTVTADADGGTSGVQLDVVATIDTACAGRTATTTCDDGGTDTLDVTVPSDGVTTFRITGCVGVDECTINYSCSVQVSNGAEILTSENLTISIDNEGPGVLVQVTGVRGVVPCGGSAGDLDDLEGGTPGTQLAVRVSSIPGSTRSLTHNGSPVTLDAGGSAQLTLIDGLNTFIGQSCDSFGNCSTHACEVTRAELPVNFNAPFVDDAVLGASAGIPSGGGLAVDICGTVGAIGASVAITITPTIPGGDGPAVIGGTDWCRNGVTLLEPGPYTIQADATAGPDIGSAAVGNISIDLTPGGAPTNLVLTALDRQEAELSWTAPSDAGGPVDSYLIKMDTSPIDAASFDGATTIAAPAPGLPGTTDSTSQAQLRAGTEYYFAIVSVDPIGNRSAVVSDGPIILDFSSSGVIDGPASATAQEFGHAIAGGDLNNDGFDDIVVGAPVTSSSAGEFHVFLGSATGIGATPDFTFTASAADGRFGQAVAVLDWNDDGVDDVAVSAPFRTSFAGLVEIYYGGALFDPGVHPQARTQGESSVTITNSGQGVLTSGALGFSMSAVRFNADTRDDLVLGLPFAYSFNGGAVVLLGGSSAAAITIDDDDPAGLMGSMVWHIPVETGTTGCSWGNFVFGLGAIDGPSDTEEDIGIGGSVDFSACAPGDDFVFVYRGRAANPSGGMETLLFDNSVDLMASLSAGSETSLGRNITSFGDGAGSRSLVISAHRGAGVVYVLPGTTTNGGAAAAVPIESVATTTITAPTEQLFGISIAGNSSTELSDVDGDGFEDLLIAGGASTPTLFVWYGPTLPVGDTEAEMSAGHTVSAVAPPFDTIEAAAWVGDVNADGLDDICWSETDLTGTAQDHIEVLY